MMRKFMTLLHRYVGLVMAGFLVIAGLTGTLLAFNHELDEAINPHVFKAFPTTKNAERLDPLYLREIVQSQYPYAHVNWVDFFPTAGRASIFWIEGKSDPVTGVAKELENDQVFVDPYTGSILGERKWGDISQGLINLMPFVYRLHYSLALDELGTLIFGVIALLWTLDCFIAAYLTFPAAKRKTAFATGGSRFSRSQRQWFARWWLAWKVRWTSNAFKINFDLHRAGGLWPWAMLFIIAWSSVGFNLQEIYRPVMSTIFAVQEEHLKLPTLEKEQTAPKISWQQARSIGQLLMHDQAQQHGFEILEHSGLSYEPHRGLYRYRVLSSQDVSQRWGGTSLWFDANNGEFKALFVPTGKAMGDTIGTWMFTLHMAAVWGLPFQIFMVFMGLAVTLLSITGVIIWWRKRKARRESVLRKKGRELLQPAEII